MRWTATSYRAGGASHRGLRGVPAPARPLAGGPRGAGGLGVTPVEPSEITRARVLRLAGGGSPAPAPAVAPGFRVAGGGGARPAGPRRRGFAGQERLRGEVRRLRRRPRRQAREAERLRRRGGRRAKPRRSGPSRRCRSSPLPASSRSSSPAWRRLRARRGAPTSIRPAGRPCSTPPTCRPCRRTRRTSSGSSPAASRSRPGPSPWIRAAALRCGSIASPTPAGSTPGR